ncbi:MAG: DUF1836 domain-containing protein [Oscillospiraceae bacterium]|nr:DUF1836 domain-containing protein [Oscillospiraceae bacterium]
MKDLNVTMQNTMKPEYIEQNEIPDIDLYVDQIITLLDSRLGQNKRNQDDKVITKTMVNNYSKDGLLKRIKGKKYSKEHIMMILLICGLKRGMAVQDIARVFAGLEGNLSNAEGEYSPEAVSALYAGWGEVGAQVAGSLPEFIGNTVNQLGLAGGKDDPLPAILVLTEIAAQCSRAAEALIDESFPEKKK